MSQAQYMPDFTAKREEYVLHNAGPDKIEGSWGGRPFTLPGCDEVHPHNPAVFEDGVAIPGTLVLRDTYCPDKDGSHPKPGDPFNWRASVAIKNVLGIDPQSGQAKGPYAQKGVSYVQMPASKEDIERIMVEGKKRYYVFMVGWAEHQTRAYAEAVDLARRAGVTAPPPGGDYHKATTILEQHQKEMEKRYGKQNLGVEEQEEVDLEFMVFAKARAMALAKDAAEAQKVSKEELAENMLQDPDVLKALRKKYRIRKKGFAEGAEPPTEDVPA